MSKKKKNNNTKVKQFFANNWRKIIFIISTGFVIFLLEGSIYNFIFPEKWENFWIIIPVAIFLICWLFKKWIKPLYRVPLVMEFSNLLAVVILFFNVFQSNFSNWFIANFKWFSFALVIVGIIGFIILLVGYNDNIFQKNIKSNKKLFNLFYLNTSKAHEIAMLIDNKVVKNVENEHIASYTSTTNHSVRFGKQDSALSENSISTEETSKQRVLESFDVKQTKSVMLRTIYDEVSKNTNCQFDEGRLVLLENVQLKQINVDDTVLILNVLQDSKLKNQKNDSIEINLNKMMEKMLDDFTIDYSFEYPDKSGEGPNYIIRLPYKSTSNFENGYQHNDLQLGKLSIIGIYRGEIDFSEKESMSSKFLDLLFESYRQDHSNETNFPGMKLSYCGVEKNTVDFDFNHPKLNGKKHLIDVIAIIQEINLGIGKL